MNARRAFLLICIIYLLGFFSHGLYLRKTVYGDGIFYYSWLRSVVVDHDLDFRNEYAHFGVASQQARQGLPGNKYAIGPALLWFPAFSLTHEVVKGNGYGLLYQLAVGFASVAYALIGLFLLYRLLEQLFKPNISLLTILAIAFATNLFFYGSLDPVNSHALSFFAAVLFLTFLLSQEKNWLIIGASLGLLGLVRPQDLIFGILTIPFLSLSSIRYLVIGFLVTFSIQLLAWQAIYGTFWISPYLTSGGSFNFLGPHILEVLFSPQNGLFLYSPILLLGLIGLFFWKNRWRLYFSLAILLELLVISSWFIWWQGESVGGRMFISSLPLLAWGLSHFFTRLGKYQLSFSQIILILVAPLSALNILLTFFYLLLH